MHFLWIILAYSLFDISTASPPKENKKQDNNVISITDDGKPFEKWKKYMTPHGRIIYAHLWQGDGIQSHPCPSDREEPDDVVQLRPHRNTEFVDKNDMNRVDRVKRNALGEGEKVAKHYVIIDLENSKNVQIFVGEGEEKKPRKYQRRAIKRRRRKRSLKRSLRRGTTLKTKVRSKGKSAKPKINFTQRYGKSNMSMDFLHNTEMNTLSGLSLRRDLQSNPILDHLPKPKTVGDYFDLGYLLGLTNWYQTKHQMSELEKNSTEPEVHTQEPKPEEYIQPEEEEEEEYIQPEEEKEEEYIQPEEEEEEKYIQPEEEEEEEEGLYEGLEERKKKLKVGGNPKAKLANGRGRKQKMTKEDPKKSKESNAENPTTDAAEASKPGGRSKKKMNPKNIPVTNASEERKAKKLKSKKSTSENPLMVEHTKQPKRSRENNAENSKTDGDESYKPGGSSKKKMKPKNSSEGNALEKGKAKIKSKKSTSENPLIVEHAKQPEKSKESKADNFKADPAESSKPAGSSKKKVKPKNISEGNALEKGKAKVKSKKSTSENPLEHTKQSSRVGKSRKKHAEDNIVSTPKPDSSNDYSITSKPGTKKGKKAKEDSTNKTTLGGSEVPTTAKPKSSKVGRHEKASKNSTDPDRKTQNPKEKPEKCKSKKNCMTEISESKKKAKSTLMIEGSKIRLTPELIKALVSNDRFRKPIEKLLREQKTNISTRRTVERGGQKQSKQKGDYLDAIRLAKTSTPEGDRPYNYFNQGYSAAIKNWFQSMQNFQRQNGTKARKGETTPEDDVLLEEIVEQEEFKRRLPKKEPRKDFHGKESEMKSDELVKALLANSKFRGVVMSRLKKHKNAVASLLKNEARKLRSSILKKSSSGSSKNPDRNLISLADNANDVEARRFLKAPSSVGRPLRRRRRVKVPEGTRFKRRRARGGVIYKRLRKPYIRYRPKLSNNRGKKVFLKKRRPVIHRNPGAKIRKPHRNNRLSKSRKRGHKGKRALQRKQRQKKNLRARGRGKVSKKARQTGKHSTGKAAYSAMRARKRNGKAKRKKNLFKKTAIEYNPKTKRPVKETVVEQVIGKDRRSLMKEATQNPKKEYGSTLDKKGIPRGQLKISKTYKKPSGEVKQNLKISRKSKRNVSKNGVTPFPVVVNPTDRGKRNFSISFCWFCNGESSHEEAHQPPEETNSTHGKHPGSSGPPPPTENFTGSSPEITEESQSKRKILKRRRKTLLNVM